MEMQEDPAYKAPAEQFPEPDRQIPNPKDSDKALRDGVEDIRSKIDNREKCALAGAILGSVSFQ